MDWRVLLDTLDDVETSLVIRLFNFNFLVPTFITARPYPLEHESDLIKYLWLIDWMKQQEISSLKCWNFFFRFQKFSFKPNCPVKLILLQATRVEIEFSVLHIKNNRKSFMIRIRPRLVCFCQIFQFQYSSSPFSWNLSGARLSVPLIRPSSTDVDRPFSTTRFDYRQHAEWFKWKVDVKMRWKFFFVFNLNFCITSIFPLFISFQLTEASVELNFKFIDGDERIGVADETEFSFGNKHRKIEF